MKVERFHKTIKDFYWACIYNWSKPIFDNKYTLYEKIQFEKDNYLKDKTRIKFEEYKLPETYNVNSQFFDKNKWDQISTFNIGLIKDKLSENEKEFYENIKLRFDDEKDIHLFRNGINKNNDYFIEYFNSENKIAKFFPDFIIINEQTKECFIFEAKGFNKKNIDNESEYKFKSLDKKDVFEKISIKNGFQLREGLYQVSFYNNDLEFWLYQPNKEKQPRDFKNIKENILGKLKQTSDFIKKINKKLFY